MSSTVEGHFRIGSLQELRRRGCKVATVGEHTIAVFYHNGQVYAVDDQCPHSGYSLGVMSKVQDGIVTCAWHQARFDLSSGSSLDPSIDDVLTFPVTIVNGEVWVNPAPQPKDEATDRPS